MRDWRNTLNQKNRSSFSRTGGWNYDGKCKFTNWKTDENPARLHRFSLVYTMYIVSYLMFTILAIIYDWNWKRSFYPRFIIQNILNIFYVWSDKQRNKKKTNKNKEYLTSYPVVGYILMKKIFDFQKFDRWCYLNEKRLLFE